MTKKVPKRLAHLPEIPVNGNYIFTGRHTWSHAEGLSKAYRVWREGGGGGITKSGTYGRRDLVVVDVSDDFQISHVDGGVRATTVTLVYLQDSKGKVQELVNNEG